MKAKGLSKFVACRAREGRSKCRESARGYHCKSCRTPVCKKHQEPSGHGNHGGLVMDPEDPMTPNRSWRRIR